MRRALPMMMVALMILLGALPVFPHVASRLFVPEAQAQEGDPTSDPPAEEPPPEDPPVEEPPQEDPPPANPAPPAGSGSGGSTGGTPGGSGSGGSVKIDGGASSGGGSTSGGTSSGGSSRVVIDGGGGSGGRDGGDGGGGRGRNGSSRGDGSRRRAKAFGHRDRHVGGGHDGDANASDDDTDDVVAVWSGPRVAGSFATNRLVAAAARLRSLGVSDDVINHRVYAPFIIAGNAEWSDTWGAPRYGPAPGQVRTHQGQDIFCDFGTPVLAAEEGTVNFTSDLLGGDVVQLYLPSGGHLYYAHLQGWNTAEFSSGDHVVPGDVIGWCGDSGNAKGGAPHVHFGHYIGGVAQDPMQMLMRWLETAGERVEGQLAKASAERVEQIGTLTMQRRFGGTFAPDLSEIDVSAEALLASGSDPATGTFALAELAVQSALIQNADPSTQPSIPAVGSGLGADGGHAIEEYSPLDQFLQQVQPMEHADG